MRKYVVAVELYRWNVQGKGVLFVGKAVIRGRSRKFMKVVFIFESLALRPS